MNLISKTTRRSLVSAMAVFSSALILFAAAQAFGPVNPDNEQRFPRYQFPPDLALSENLLIEFADASGYKQAGRIVRIGTHDVEIDFNHPLAGKDILFSAEIHSIEPDAVKLP